MTALLDVLSTWDGEKLRIDTTAGFTYEGWSRVNADSTLTFLEDSPGSENYDVIVLDHIVAVRHLASEED